MNLGIVLASAGVIFCMGMFGVLTQRNLLKILVSVLLIFVSTVVNIVAFNYFAYLNSVRGYVFAVFVLMFCMLELTVGVGLIVFLQRERKTVLEDKLNSFKG